MKKIYKSEETKKKAEYLADQYNISVEELAYMLGDEKLYKKYLLRPIYKPSKVIDAIHKELTELYIERNELNDDEIREKINNINKRNVLILNSDVKFVLTDIGINQGIIGNLATKLCNCFDNRFPYGALHAGLMIDESIIQWGSGYFGSEIVFPSSDLRSILFSIEIENSQKKEKIRKLLINLGFIAILGISIMGLGGPIGTILGSLITVGGGISYLLSLSWEIKKINEDELNKNCREMRFL